MLAKERLLDLVENFVLFDQSKPGGTRKIVARNHQVLGVNNAVESVQTQEDLKRQFPPEKRLTHRVALIEPREVPETAVGTLEDAPKKLSKAIDLPLIERAHPDLGRLGVFWHTQGSGKSYSMAFFAEKVRRVVPGNFTFVVMTDRDDLDDQIWRTFAGCGITDEPSRLLNCETNAGRTVTTLARFSRVLPVGTIRRLRTHHRFGLT
jgi:type I restriction enzyme R subunit